jgi:hypothetical protein
MEFRRFGAGGRQYVVIQNCCVTLTKTFEVPPFSVPGVMRVLIGLRVRLPNLGCAAAGAQA